MLPWFATFWACLLIDLEIGIIIGIGVNVAIMLYPSTRPAIKATAATVSHKKSLTNITDFIQRLLLSAVSSVEFPSDFHKYRYITV